MLKNNSTILSVAYLAPIQYYKKLVSTSIVYIEQYENFIKQTYRNRCNIYAANGMLPLSIPVQKEFGSKILIKDIKISYDTNWQKQHWRSIESAYLSSPYFEFFSDDLFVFYHKKFKFLFDFNIQIQQVILEALTLKPKLTFTKEYYNGNQEAITDYRHSIHPKKVPAEFISKQYTQVFSNKHGFISNMSIVDLLFNEGPVASSLLIEK